jgi:hypothetical protein
MISGVTPHGCPADADLVVCPLTVACRPEGAPNHRWNVSACAGSPLGQKGMLTAAKVLALTGLEVIRRPDLAARARAELRKQIGGRPYRPPVPDAALDAHLAKAR